MSTTTDAGDVTPSISAEEIRKICPEMMANRSDLYRSILDLVEGHPGESELKSQLEEKVTFYVDIYGSYLDSLQQLIDHGENCTSEDHEHESDFDRTHVQMRDFDGQLGYAIFKRSQQFCEDCEIENCGDCSPILEKTKDPDFRQIVFDYLFK